jgi:hypothetical protein
MIVPTVFIERRYGAEAREAAAIAVALPAAIALARERGWSSERAFREAEARARSAVESSMRQPALVLRS